MAKKLSLVEEVFHINEQVVVDRVATLSHREREVAEAMSRGLPNGKIAEQLGISSRTLDIHRATLKRKLYAKTSSLITNYMLAFHYIHESGMKLTPNREIEHV